MAIDLIEIQKVDKNTYLADDLLNFVENFSWLDVKEHTVKVIQNWEFEAWETPPTTTYCGTALFCRGTSLTMMSAAEVRVVGIGRWK